MSETRTEEVKRAAKELDAAISAYTSALYGEGIVVDWVMMAEAVHADETRQIQFGFSDSMTSFKAYGMAESMKRAAANLMALGA